MSHPSLCHAPRLRLCVLLAGSLLVAGHVPAHGADGFNTIELATLPPACVPSGDLVPIAVEGGADGFSETGSLPQGDVCVGAADGLPSGWQAAGDWESHRGWTQFGQGGDGTLRHVAGGLWGGSPTAGQGHVLSAPFLALWPGAGPASGAPGPDPAASSTDDDPAADSSADTATDGRPAPAPDAEDGAAEPTLLAAAPSASVARTIPEPATLVLLGGALVLLGLLRGQLD